MNWICHVCGHERPDAAISVAKKDTSALHDLPAGTIGENIRFCNDVPRCVELATAAESFEDLGRLVVQSRGQRVEDCP